MGPTTEEIVTHIEDTRDDLGANLHELERKVKAVTDWRQQFQANPMTMMGLALGGGVLVAAMLGGRNRNGRHRRALGQEETPVSRETHRALETWENIKGALIGVAAMRFTKFVDEIVPGFNEQLQRIEGKAQAQERDSRLSSPSTH